MVLQNWLKYVMNHNVNGGIATELFYYMCCIKDANIACTE